MTSWQAVSQIVGPNLSQMGPAVLTVGHSPPLPHKEYNVSEGNNNPLSAALELLRPP